MLPAVLLAVSQVRLRLQLPQTIAVCWVLLIIALQPILATQQGGDRPEPLMTGGHARLRLLLLFTTAHLVRLRLVVVLLMVRCGVLSVMMMSVLKQALQLLLWLAVIGLLPVGVRVQLPTGLVAWRLLLLLLESELRSQVECVLLSMRARVFSGQLSSEGSWLPHGCRIPREKACCAPPCGLSVRRSIPHPAPSTAVLLDTGLLHAPARNVLLLLLWVLLRRLGLSLKGLTVMMGGLLLGINPIIHRLLVSPMPLWHAVHYILMDARRRKPPHLVRPGIDVLRTASAVLLLLLQLWWL